MASATPLAQLSPRTHLDTQLIVLATGEILAASWLAGSLPAGKSPDNDDDDRTSPSPRQASDLESERGREKVKASSLESRGSTS